MAKSITLRPRKSCLRDRSRCVEPTTERYHKIFKIPCLYIVVKKATMRPGPTFVTPLWHPCDVSVFGFRRLATHSSNLPSYFPPCVCSVRNVHSGCCGTAWSCSPGPRSSSPEALSLGSSSPSAAFIFQRFQAPWNAMKCHEMPWKPCFDRMMCSNCRIDGFPRTSSIPEHPRTS